MMDSEREIEGVCGGGQVRRVWGGSGWREWKHTGWQVKSGGAVEWGRGGRCG